MEDYWGQDRGSQAASVVIEQGNACGYIRAPKAAPAQALPYVPH